MIRVSTESDTVDIEATPEDVKVENSRLTIRRKGIVVAVFRRWESWHETTPGQRE